MEKVHNLVEAARSNEKIVFLPISSTNKLIDFKYRDGNTYHCFQCTIGTTPSTNPEHLYQLVLNIYNNEEDNVLPSVAGKDLPRVKIYYAVPVFRFDDFSTKNPNAIMDAKNICKQKRNVSERMKNDSLISKKKKK